MALIKEEVATDMAYSVSNSLELGHLCDYCNIKQGWSIMFNSFDEYVNHVINNHPGLNAYHDNKTDLHSFAERTRNEWEQFLKKRQKEYLKHLYGPGFVGLPSTL
jgi:hypothetical protein